MKMKEFGPLGGGVHPWHPPIRQWSVIKINLRLKFSLVRTDFFSTTKNYP